MSNTRFTAIALAICGVVWLLVVISGFLRARDNPNYGREPIASESEITRFATQALDQLQARSLNSQNEYCALVIEDAQGNLSLSRVAEGEEAECALPWELPLERFAVATIHTHGVYSRAYDSEVPSVLDMESDIREQIDGFVGTPGGRVWFTDWQTEETVLVCDEKCISQDPNYREDDWGGVDRSYTLEQLKARQAL